MNKFCQMFKEQIIPILYNVFKSKQWKNTQIISWDLNNHGIVPENESKRKNKIPTIQYL